MNQIKKIFLVGYMGCGKSTLAKRLARRLGWRMVDTDQEIERLEGASINDIFHYEGEEHFRHMERREIERWISAEEPVVVSTGGGLPAWQDNMERMNGAGLTVYIRRTAEGIASRLSPYGRQKRPKLRGLSDAELVAFMTENMKERTPWYEQAHQILDGELKSDEEMVQLILHELNQ